MVMFNFIYSVKLMEVGLKPVLHKRYVHDNNMAGEEIAAGMGIIENEDGK